MICHIDIRKRRYIFLQADDQILLHPQPGHHQGGDDLRGRQVAEADLPPADRPGKNCCRERVVLPFYLDPQSA